MTKITPAEILCLQSRSRSPIDETKSLDELSVAELMLLKHDPVLRDKYVKDRAHYTASLSNDEKIAENDRQFTWRGVECILGHISNKLFSRNPFMRM